MNKLNNDIIILIYDKLNISDKNNFIKINKLYYDLLISDFKKYKIMLYVNNDYLEFYNYITNYEYNKLNEKIFINKVIIKAFMNIPHLWLSNYLCLYDLRYVFEILYNKYKIESSDIKIYNAHFYIHFYQKILNCLDDTREKTLENINKTSYLTSLKQNLCIKKNKRNGENFKWVSIKK